MVNNFGVPARFDNDIACISPRLSGFQAYAMGKAGAPSRQAIYQAYVDYAPAQAL